MPRSDMKRDQATTTRTIEVRAPDRGFSRADIVFDGVEQAGCSFQARVFVNNPQADERTTRSRETGYAGAFHVYGYGQRPRETRTQGSIGPVAPITKYLVATNTVREALRRTHKLAITVVPVPPLPGPHFSDVWIAFDRCA